ncbi:MAG: ParB/RepB/Spo0J family partition protein [Phycisphaerae bacterium]
MSKPTRRLGRGLDSLVSTLVPTTGATDPAGPPDAARSSAGHVEATTVPTAALNANPYQPRSSLEDAGIAALAASIERSGLLQPIIVRRRDQRYEIIAGERRWAAARKLGLSQVPVIIRNATEEQMIELALVENLQREDLNPIDRATAYRMFCDQYSLTPDEVARRVGEDRTTVVNYLRLLELPTPIRDLVSNGAIGMGHARALLGITNDEKRARVADAILANGLSVRAVEELVRRERTRRSGDSPAPADRPASISPHLADLQRRFEQALKTKVTIREGRRKGSGRIVIEFYTLDDFDRIAAMLAVPTE